MCRTGTEIILIYFLELELAPVLHKRSKETPNNVGWYFHIRHKPIIPLESLGQIETKGHQHTIQWELAITPFWTNPDFI
jgi:hypothetical protein